MDVMVASKICRITCQKIWRRVSRKVSILSKMVLSTLDSGKVFSVTVSENKLGQMEPDTKVSGKRTRHMDAASSTMWMGMCSMVSGTKIKLTALEPTLTSMALSMKVIGLMIFRMERARRRGRMALSMKASTKRV